MADRVRDNLLKAIHETVEIRKAAADIRAVAKHLQTQGMLKQEAKLLAALKVLTDALGE